MLMSDNEVQVEFSTSVQQQQQQQDFGNTADFWKHSSKNQLYNKKSELAVECTQKMPKSFVFLCCPASLLPLRLFLGQGHQLCTCTVTWPGHVVILEESVPIRHDQHQSWTSQWSQTGGVWLVWRIMIHVAAAFHLSPSTQTLTYTQVCGQIK